MPKLVVFASEIWRLESLDNGQWTVAELRKGLVLLAVGGVRTYNTSQCNYLRDRQPSPELDLVVWQAHAYQEVKASPPNHRFGVEMEEHQGE